MKKKTESEFAKSDNTMRKLVSVSHDEIKAKLNLEKEKKKEKRSGKKSNRKK
jgi:hypothetical protein